MHVIVCDRVKQQISVMRTATSKEKLCDSTNRIDTECLQWDPYHDPLNNYAKFSVSQKAPGWWAGTHEYFPSNRKLNQ